MTTLTKTKLDCRCHACPEVLIQEASDKQIEKDLLLKRSQETLLNELKELFLPYWYNTCVNIEMVPAMEAVELVLKMIQCWSNQDISGKAIGVTNKHLMEKINTLHDEIEVNKEEIVWLTKLTLSKSGKRKVLDTKLMAVIKERNTHWQNFGK